MPLVDPRPLAKVVVGALVVAAVAHLPRLVFRVVEVSDAVVAYDFFMSSQDGQPDYALSASDQLAHGLFSIFLLVPLQIVAAVLWFEWHRRVRNNAALIPQADAVALARRARLVGLAAGAVVLVKFAIFGLATSDRFSPDFYETIGLVDFQLLLDVATVALLIAIAVATSAWTREQDRLVRPQQ